jgi:multidrug efflux pump subunit AcrA (membrane-fusion protein)
MSELPKPSLKGSLVPALRWTRELITGNGEPSATDGTLEFLRTGRVVRMGLSVVVIFVLGFIVWATFAPLDSALMAPGVIVVESHRKTIQHLEGGIVKDILVKEGQAVKTGQTLILLDDTQARVQLALLQDESDGLAADEARLIAARDGVDHVTFPPELLARQGDPKVAEEIHGA